MCACSNPVDISHSCHVRLFLPCCPLHSGCERLKQYCNARFSELCMCLLWIVPFRSRVPFDEVSYVKTSGYTLMWYNASSSVYTPGGLRLLLAVLNCYTSASNPVTNRSQMRGKNKTTSDCITTFARDLTTAGIQVLLCFIFALRLFYWSGMNVANGLEEMHLAFLGVVGGSAVLSAAALASVMRHLRYFGT